MRWDRTHRNSDGCLLWLGPLTKMGYGDIWVEGYHTTAPRAAYFAYYGKWPKVCRHLCDNKACCEPLHLISGTHAENNQDQWERNPKAFNRKYPRKVIMEAIKMCNGSYGAVKRASDKFGINYGHLRSLVSNKKPKESRHAR